jgi:Lar family restriction alleviation protein
MSEALKPCPFCGGDAEYNEGQSGDHKPWYYYACSECEAMQPYVSEAEKSPFDMSFNRARDAEAWNARADLAAAQVAAAYEAVAFRFDEIAKHDQGGIDYSDAVGVPISNRTELEESVRNAVQVAQDIRALTPDDARAALDKLLAEAREKAAAYATTNAIIAIFGRQELL